MVADFIIAGVRDDAALNRMSDKSEFGGTDGIHVTSHKLVSRGW